MRLRPALAALVLASAVLLSSGHRFANGFVLDDVRVTGADSIIHDWGNLADVWTHRASFAPSDGPGAVRSVDTYRPVPMTLFMIDAALGGRSTWPYHLTNLLLHVFCVLGVFWAALLWRDDRFAALYGALVFAVHPWAVEAHVWIDGRSDPACLAFGLVGLILLLHAERRRSVPLFAAGGVALLLGLLSKETLLFVFPALLFMPAIEGGERSFRGRLVTVGAAAITYLAARVAVLGGMRAHQDGAMLGEAAKNLPWLLLDGLRQSVAPDRPYLRSLRDEYATLAIWQVVIAALVIAAIAVVSWRAREKSPLAAWTALWFFLPLFPIAIISTILWPGFGRYLYVPLAGFAWLLAALVPLAREKIPRARLRLAFAGLHIFVLAGLAGLFTHDFVSDDTLYEEAIRARPEVAMGHGWLGMARARRGDHENAIVPLMRAAQLDPLTSRYLIHAGRSVLATGDRANAHEIAERGIRRFEGDAREASYHLLAVSSMSERSPEIAVAHLVRCLEVWPGRGDCRDALHSLVHDASDAAANQAALDALVEQRPSLEPLTHP